MSAPAGKTVAWFEIGAPDVNAARAFYGQRRLVAGPRPGVHAHHRPWLRQPLRQHLNTRRNIPPNAVLVVPVADIPALAVHERPEGSPPLPSRKEEA